MNEIPGHSNTDDRCSQFDQCEKHFEAIHRKLDQLDEAVRGNGRPGIQLRLDRLEAAERSRSRLIWLILGCAVTLAFNAVWKHLACLPAGR